MGLFRKVNTLSYFLRIYGNKELEFDLGEFSDETLGEYCESLSNVPDDLFGNDKDILKEFIEIYRGLVGEI